MAVLLVKTKAILSETFALVFAREEAVMAAA
jgi:hypothetical protein